MHSNDHEATAASHVRDIVGQVSFIRKDDTLQEAVDNGARVQWVKDASWLAGALAVTEPSQ